MICPFFLPQKAIRLQPWNFSCQFAKRSRPFLKFVRNFVMFSLLAKIPLTRPLCVESVLATYIYSSRSRRTCAMSTIFSKDSSTYLARIYKLVDITPSILLDYYRLFISFQKYKCCKCIICPPVFRGHVYERMNTHFSCLETPSYSFRLVEVIAIFFLPIQDLSPKPYGLRIRSKLVYTRVKITRQHSHAWRLCRSQF